MRAIVFGGGGSKGAFGVGVLKHLLGDLKLQYDLLCGVSVGAINCGFLAMFRHGQESESIQKLEKVWRDLKTSDIYIDWANWPKPFCYLGYIKALWKPSFYNSAPLISLIQNNYNANRIKASGKKLRIGAVNLNTGEFRTFDEDFYDISNAILASSAFPGAFLPINIDGQFWVDGGVKKNNPFKTAISSGADIIDIIITSPEKNLSDFITDFNIFTLGPRIVDIMSEDIMLNDLDKALEINRLIKSGVNVSNKRYIDIRIFRPDKQLVKSILAFDQKFIGPMIDKGYEVAQKITGKYG